MQMLKRSGAMPMTIKPAGASLPVDTRVAILEGACKALQEQLQNHQELLESVFRPDGRIELRPAQRLEIIVGSSRISIDTTGVHIQSSLKVTVDASKFEVNAGEAAFNSGIVRTPGTITCQTIQASNVIGSSYTPGAGNLF